MEDSTNYCCQNNVRTFIQVLRFVVNMLFVVVFTVFKHTYIAAPHEHSVPWRRLLWGDDSRRYGAPRYVTMGGARETALASSTHAPFTWILLTFTGWNWKCHVVIVIKTDLSGFVVPVHSGLCKQYAKSLRLTSSGFNFLFRTHPLALGQQTPPEPVFIPWTTPSVKCGSKILILR